MKIAVILGSSREGRIGERVAKWAAREAAKDSENEVTIIDLQDHPLPFFNEAISPQFNPDRHPEPAVEKWLNKVAAADAYIIVSPEYNRSFPAVLKNAIDYIAFEASGKPAAVVTYSAASTGGEAAQVQLRPVLGAVRMMTVPTYVCVAVAGTTITEEGETEVTVAAQPYGPHTAIASAVAELKQFVA
jgi:NAD(P)H-dependent FMN reductase